MAGKGKTTITTQGVLYIDGKEAENSLNSVVKITRQLRTELKKLPQDSDEFNKKAAELTRAEKKYTEMNDKIKETRAHLKASGREVRSFNDLFFQLANNAKKQFAIAGGGIKGFGKTVKVVAAESWAAISSIPIIGWVAGITGALVMGLREVMKYNDLVESERGKLENLFGGNFQGLDEMRVQVRALAKTFDVSFDDIGKTVQKLYNTGLADTEEAIEAIKIGLATAPNKSAFLSQLESAADRAKQTGISLQEAMNMTKAMQGSFMGVDQVYRRLERSNMRFQKGLEGNKALVDAFGESFAKDLIDGVNSGQITTVQALEKVRQKTEETGLSAQKQAKLSAEFFGARSASAAAYQEILGLIHEANQDQYDDLTDLQQETVNFIELNERLEKAKDDAMNSDAVKGFKVQWQMLWKEIKIAYYNFVGWITDVDRKVKKFETIFLGVLASIPKSAIQAFSNVKSTFSSLVDTIMAGADSISKALTFDFSGAKKSYNNFKKLATETGDGLKKTANDFLVTIGSGGKKAAEKFDKDFKDNINAAQALEDKKGSQSSQGTAPNEPKKPADDEAKKTAKELEEIQKAEKEAYKKRLDLLAKFDEAQAELLDDQFEKQLAKEKNRRKKEEQEYIIQLQELIEKRNKARTEVEKKNLDASIQLLSDTEILREEAHQNKLLAIQQKADVELYKSKIAAQQKQLEFDRAKDEEEIQNITSLNEAKQALQNQQYLKLTDQELKNIRTLEDAKRALREAADRKALQAQLKALTEQREMLKKELEGLTGEAAEELKENLDQLYFKILRIKSAIQGGEEEDQASVLDERNQEMDQVDVLGFSAQQWADMFDNLDTTKGKLEAVGMVFQSLGKAGQMYSDLIRGLNERDLRNFEQIQGKKQKELKRQLDEGWITNEEYQKRIQNLEAETANKKAEMDYKQAKADKISRMFSIIGNTAVAVSKSLANPVLAAIVGTLGAVQLGIVASQPLPEKPKYAVGGYTGNGFGSPDDTGYRPAGIVHENEWVAPEWMLEEPKTARIIDYLESVRGGRLEPLADGGFSEKKPTDQSSSDTPPAFDYDRLYEVMTRLENLLVVLDENGIDAYIAEDAKNARKLLKMIKSYEKLESKNKH